MEHPMDIWLNDKWIERVLDDFERDAGVTPIPEDQASLSCQVLNVKMFDKVINGIGGLAEVHDNKLYIKALFTVEAITSFQEVQDRTTCADFIQLKNCVLVLTKYFIMTDIPQNIEKSEIAICVESFYMNGFDIDPGIRRYTLQNVHNHPNVCRGIRRMWRDRWAPEEPDTCPEPLSDESDEERSMLSLLLEAMKESSQSQPEPSESEPNKDLRILLPAGTVVAFEVDGDFTAHLDSEEAFTLVVEAVKRNLVIGGEQLDVAESRDQGDRPDSQDLNAGMALRPQQSDDFSFLDPAEFEIPEDALEKLLNIEEWRPGYIPPYSEPVASSSPMEDVRFLTEPSDGGQIPGPDSSDAVAMEVIDDIDASCLDTASREAEKDEVTSIAEFSQDAMEILCNCLTPVEEGSQAKLPEQTQDSDDNLSDALLVVSCKMQNEDTVKDRQVDQAVPQKDVRFLIEPSDRGQVPGPDSSDAVAVEAVGDMVDASCLDTASREAEKDEVTSCSIAEFSQDAMEILCNCLTPVEEGSQAKLPEQTQESDGYLSDALLSVSCKMQDKDAVKDRQVDQAVPQGPTAIQHQMPETNQDHAAESQVEEVLIEQEQARHKPSQSQRPLSSKRSRSDSSLEISKSNQKDACQTLPTSSEHVFAKDALSDTVCDRNEDGQASMKIDEVRRFVSELPEENQGWQEPNNMPESQMLEDVTHRRSKRRKLCFDQTAESSGKAASSSHRVASGSSSEGAGCGTEVNQTAGKNSNKGGKSTEVTSVDTMIDETAKNSRKVAMSSNKVARSSEAADKDPTAGSSHKVAQSSIMVVRSSEVTNGNTVVDQSVESSENVAMRSNKVATCRSSEATNKDTVVDKTAGRSRKVAWSSNEAARSLEGTNDKILVERAEDPPGIHLTKASSQFPGRPSSECADYTMDNTETTSRFRQSSKALSSAGHTSGGESANDQDQPLLISEISNQASSSASTSRTLKRNLVPSLSVIPRNRTMPNKSTRSMASLLRPITKLRLPTIPSSIPTPVHSLTSHQPPKKHLSECSSSKSTDESLDTSAESDHGEDDCNRLTKLKVEEHIIDWCASYFASLRKV